MENRNTKPNGVKIRELRELAGMTQEKLGLMSRLDRRTVQRAEGGSPIRMESLSDIASALSVPLPQIIEVTGSPQSEDAEDLAAQSLIVLRPVESGMALINTVHACFDAKITCEAEPTVENIEVLTALTASVEGMMPDPWLSPMQESGTPLSAKLRQAVQLSEQIKQLHGFGIAVYVSTYTAQTQVPHYDMDEGGMYITTRTPYTLETIGRILIAPIARGDRITLKVDDLYVPPKAPVFDADDEDIPF